MAFISVKHGSKLVFKAIVSTLNEDYINFLSPSQFGPNIHKPSPVNGVCRNKKYIYILQVGAGKAKEESLKGNSREACK